MPPKRKLDSVEEPPKAKRAKLSTKVNAEKKSTKIGKKTKSLAKAKTETSQGKKSPSAKSVTLNKSEDVKKTSKDVTKTTNKSKNVMMTESKPQAKAAAGKLDLFSLLKEDGWRRVLMEEKDKDYFSALTQQLQSDYNNKVQVFPPQPLIFNAFNITPIDKIKVVILGQDPYHDDGQAMGLSFSVPNGVKIPPSLRNIYRELEADKNIPGFKSPDLGNLESWAKQGVFLLNATLTVKAHEPNSHAKYGWQKFTDRVIQVISEECNGVVFILWGGFAHKKEKLIDATKHCVIKTAHPSPLSFNKFMNCRCFSDADRALIKFGKKPINWSL